jgi:uncharacterized protein (TIGR03792 family)
MVIEWLEFRVPSDDKDIFLKHDQAIWTRALAGYKGFLGKEILSSPNDHSLIIFMIRWQTRALWKAIPSHELALIDSQFNEAMGDISYEILESKEYFVI